MLNESDIGEVQALNSKLSGFCVECNSCARHAYKTQTGEDGISLPDPVAMSIALDPTIGTHWSSHYVEIETHSELTRGMTVVDRLNVAHDARNQAVWASVLPKEAYAKVCCTIDP